MKIFVILLFLFPLFAGAQSTHTVQAKETLYSLARKYNVHPRELAEYNNISVQTSLTLGQVIKIPAKTTMAPLTVPPPVKTEIVAEKKEVVKPVPVVKEEVKTAPAKNEGPYPIYHKVEKKETLYHISKTYNNVSIADIKKWNKLTSDGLSEGTRLIVGYSKNKNATAETSEVPESPKMKTVETVKQKEEVKPVVKEPVVEVVKATVPVVKEEPKQVNVTGKDFNGGVFKSIYTQQVAGKSTVSEEKGTAGTFKSTSGWEDGKYYCLSNAVQAGTIVKVTNPATQKFVYAKVLDLIPDLKQNAGLILRISNSAAQELGANGENFECTLNF